MKISETDTYLFCSKCLDETLHHVRYLNGKINKIQCDCCKSTKGMNLDFKRELYEEIYDRITSKPSRLTEEYKNEPVKLIEGLPIRVFSKPFRLMNYLHETKEAYRKIKGD